MKIVTKRGFLERYRGLMGYSSLHPENAVYITRCRRVHTWFMRFSIDVAFLDMSGKILEIFCNVSPWSVTKKVAGASGCLEMLAGAFEVEDVKIGDIINLKS